MKYYFVLTNGKDAQIQLAYLPTGDHVSGYIHGSRSVGIPVYDYGLWTRNTRPITERIPERMQQQMMMIK